MRKLVVGLSFLCGSMAFAGGGGAAGGATEFTQLRNEIELISQSATQVKQLETQLKHILSYGNTPWSDTAQKLMELQKLVNKGYAMGSSLAGLETKFKQRYGAYSKGQFFKAQYADWSNTTRDSISSAMQAAGFQADQFQSEAALASQLRGLSGSAQGQLQATQAGTAVAVELVGQMQQLRQLQVAQSQAHNAFMVGQQAAQDADNSVAQKFMNRQFRQIRFN